MVSHLRPRSRIRARAAAAEVAAVLLAVAYGLPGCAAFRSLEGVPAEGLSAAFRDPVRGGRATIDLALLGRTPPPQHVVDSGDILGVYVEGVLGGPDQAPPIFNPGLPIERPGVGYPIAVREDGTLALPTAGAIYVRGLTLPQVEAKLREEFTGRDAILRRGRERVLVSLQRPRTHDVLVIRQESGNRQGNIGAAATVNFELDKRGTGRIVELPVPQNDVLHALAATGGLPGLDARNVIYVIRRPRYQAVPEDLEPAPAAGDDADRPDAPEESPGADEVRRGGGGAGRFARDGRPALIRGQSPPAVAAGAPAFGVPGAGVAGSGAFGPGAGLPPRYVLPRGFALPGSAPPAAPLAVSPPAAAPPVLSPPVAATPAVRTASAFAPAPPAVPAPPPLALPPAAPAAPSAAPAPFEEPPRAAPAPVVDGPPRPAGPSGFPAPGRVPGVWWDGANCPPPPGLSEATMAGAQVLCIPVRLPPGSRVPFTEEDVTLHDGDVVFVEHRETDFFYTGGLLGGGQYQLPQNYDIDVLEALAIVRQRGGALQNAPLAVGGPSSLNQDVTVGGSRLFILRRTPGHPELRIEVDLRQALRDPSSRVLVRPGDYLILRYTKAEAVGAFFERLLFDSILGGISNALLISASN